MKKLTKVIVLALSLSIISSVSLFAQDKKVVKKDDKAKKEACCDHDHAKVEKKEAKSSCCDTNKPKTEKSKAKTETAKKK